MHTLIVYGTKHGTTEKCAKILKEKLNGETELKNLKNSCNIDLDYYDKVIIGGSLYIGQIQKEIKEFCEANLNSLLNKKVGLFICCMRDGDIARDEINTSFPKELIDVAIVKDYFGGEFIFKNLGFFEKIIVKKVSKIDKDTSNIRENNITEFALAMNKA